MQINQAINGLISWKKMEILVYIA